MAEPSRKVAVFIDAENTSVLLVQAIMDSARALGRVAFARVYGKAAQLASWEGAMKEFGIRAMPTPAAALKQNASDFSMTIDAVHTLHSMHYDHALIVSRDGDFVQLVLHIKEHGAEVTCAGAKQTSTNLRKHCDQWIVLEPMSATKPKKPATATKPANRPRAAKATKAAPVPKPENPNVAAEPAQSKRRARKIDTDQLIRVFDAFAKRRPEGVHYDAFVRYVANEIPGAKRGYGTWKKYLEEAGIFKLNPENRLLTLKLTGNQEDKS